MTDDRPQATVTSPPLRLRVLSDLHLDHVPWTFTPAGEDLVVLAGDLADHSRTGLERRSRLFAEIADAGLSAVYVLGNHEAYLARRPHQQVVANLRANLPAHVQWLGPQTVVDVRGVRLVGCTLWTDFSCIEGLHYHGVELTTEMAAFFAEQCINDFREIQAVAGRAGCVPEDMVGWHRAERRWLEQAISTSDRPVVVVTHFLPSRRSVAPQYGTSTLTPYFVAECEDLMRPPVTTWIHGHTHTSCRYRYSEVEVICNPRGYGNENSVFDPNLVITVGGSTGTLPR